jgi:large subunit ribosomal protein L25
METVEIKIERRSDRGGSSARRLRARGKVPAILYGPKRTTTSILVEAEEFERKVVHLEGAHLIRLLHAGGSDAELHERMVLVRDMQLHPVSGRALHADFYEVDLTELLVVSVTLHFIGKPVGVVNGGILQPILREVEVECLPTEIPEFIEVDVSALDIHDAVHVAQLMLPEGVSPVGDGTRTVVTVLPPSIEAKPTEVAAEGAAVAPTGEAGAPGAAAPAAEPAAAAAPSTPKKKEG